MLRGESSYFELVSGKSESCDRSVDWNLLVRLSIKELFERTGKLPVCDSFCASMPMLVFVTGLCYAVCFITQLL